MTAPVFSVHARQRLAAGHDFRLVEDQLVADAVRMDAVLRHHGAIVVAAAPFVRAVLNGPFEIQLSWAKAQDANAARNRVNRNSLTRNMVPPFCALAR